MTRRNKNKIRKRKTKNVSTLINLICMQAAKFDYFLFARQVCKLMSFSARNRLTQATTY